MSEKLLNEIGSPGRRGISLPPLDVPQTPSPPSQYLRQNLPLPEVSEIDVVRHFVRLSQQNYAVDTAFYPLGSCTMKYNPKVSEDAARLPGFAHIHPYQSKETVQGALELMSRLQGYLAEITGMDAVSLQPAAGAQGELTGMLMIRAYHHSRGDTEKTKVLVPDTAHGTNPATATMAGYKVITLRSNPRGNVDLAQLRSLMSPEIAGLMLTIPNTLGIFDSQILEIAHIVHQGGGLLYGDGANMNAILGWAKPGEMGFDVMHLNLHKTFATPHGGGGPGAGPICCKDFLAPFLPAPLADKNEETGPTRYRFKTPDQSIGAIKAFWGNFGILVRAYTYIRLLGEEGLRQAAENAVINANYLRQRLKDAYHLPYPRPCMHEVVLSASPQKPRGVRAWDIAKRLIDYGFHPPTVYFPQIVEEALMIEPTETESKETLDAFIAAMQSIAEEVEKDPELVRGAPHTTAVGRLDEAQAARKPILCWGP